MLQKTIKWSLILSVVTALSGCMIDDGSDHYSRTIHPASDDQGAKDHVKVVKKASLHTRSSSPSLEPVQQTTPGPKRAAAPQIPVIQ